MQTENCFVIAFPVGEAGMVGAIYDPKNVRLGVFGVQPHETELWFELAKWGLTLPDLPAYMALEGCVRLDISSDATLRQLLDYGRHAQSYIRKAIVGKLAEGEEG